MAVFSFIENYILNVLDKAHSMLPGIEKIIAIYFNPETNSIKAKCAVEDNEEGKTIEELSIEDSDGIIDKLRIKNSYFNWYQRDETPFEVKQKKKQVQMSVFNELDNIVLCLGYFNEHDKKNDLLFFYFNKDRSNFGVSESDKFLTPTNKKIIGFMLYNSIKTIVESANKDIVILKTYNESTKSLVKRYSQTKEELLKARNSYGLSLIDLCKMYLKELGNKETRYNYIFSEDALNRIKAFQGDITELKNIIQKAVDYVSNLYFDSNEQDIYISEDYLNFETLCGGIAVKPQETQLFDKYSKTINLLEKLEKAARNVVAQSMNLTSANVGNACSTPISAPAISDAVKKHKNKIIFLLNKYPDRWKLIRSDFRPVKNVLSVNSDHLFEKIA
ncbi:MAG: hypothetical protein HGB12_16065 [Bacteroidetes bacterium]|nr:hypothetical protein [Bacteroidota bacterium]